jgi:hypothetical protein
MFKTRSMISNEHVVEEFIRRGNQRYNVQRWVPDNLTTTSKAPDGLALGDMKVNKRWSFHSSSLLVRQD